MLQQILLRIRAKNSLQNIFQNIILSLRVCSGAWPGVVVLFNMSMHATTTLPPTYRPGYAPVLLVPYKAILRLFLVQYCLPFSKQCYTLFISNMYSGTIYNQPKKHWYCVSLSRKRPVLLLRRHLMFVTGKSSSLVYHECHWYVIVSSSILCPWYAMHASGMS